MSDLITRTDDLILAIEQGTATKDEVATALGVRDAMKQRVREVSERLDAAVIAYIQQNGDIDAGSVRYYVGTESKRKLKNAGETVQAILEAGGAEALTMCLASDPLKVTGVRVVLGEDEAEKHYDVTQVPDLKTGKPKQALKSTRPTLPA